MASKMYRKNMKLNNSDVSVRPEKMLFKYVNFNYPELTYLLTL